MKTWAGIWTAIPVVPQATKPSFLQSVFSEYFLNKRKKPQASLQDDEEALDSYAPGTPLPKYASFC